MGEDNKIGKLGQHALSLIDEIHRLEDEFAEIEASTDAELALFLTDIAETKDKEEQKRKLDSEIWREFYELHDKMRRMPKIPKQDEQWRVILELWRLIQKLISKAFILQEMDPPKPPIPPDGGPLPPDGQPGPNPTTAMISALQELMPIERFREGPHEIAKATCPVEKTIAIQGGAQVQSLDPNAMSSAEWTHLTNDWNIKAARTMKIFCERAAPEGCQKVLPISVKWPPKYRGRASTSGQPPHLLFIEMELTFKCVKAV